MLTLRPGLILPLALGIALCSVQAAVAESVTLTESLGENTIATTADVKISGKIRTHGTAGKTDERPLEANARFVFNERAVDALGTDAASRRSVRVYETANATTQVDTFRTTSQLPAALRRVVVEGRAEGPVRFSLDGLMTREAVDLLDMPGDPLVLAALLPARSVELNQDYDIEKWAAQMLCSLDIVTESTLVGRVTSANSSVATIELTGEVKGARLGAPASLQVAGTLRFDRTGNFVSQANVTYVEDAEIGTISPGLRSTTTVAVTRKRTSASVDVSGIPETVPTAALKLYYDAPSWGVRMLHDRDWHVFYASPTGPKPVVILRLLDNGRLLSQMNLAKIPSASPGDHASLQQFEGDIAKSLGARFGEFVDRSQEVRKDGVKLFRVVATGQFDYKQGEETKSRAMQWTYYLIAHPDGRQLSAIFAHEPDAAELMAGRDHDVITQLQFFAPQVASN